VATAEASAAPAEVRRMARRVACAITGERSVLPTCALVPARLTGDAGEPTRVPSKRQRKLRTRLRMYGGARFVRLPSAASELRSRQPKCG
jgi:hypothetical protein